MLTGCLKCCLDPTFNTDNTDWEIRRVRRMILIVGVLICSLAVNAQAFLSARVERDLRKIQAAALVSDYPYEQARFLCNSIGPRLSGSPQAAAAVEFVRQQMRDLGLEVQLEPVSVRHWVRRSEKAELVRYPGQVAGTNQKVILTALGNTIVAPAEGVSRRRSHGPNSHCEDL